MGYVSISLGGLLLLVSILFLVRIARLALVAYWLRGVIVDIEQKVTKGNRKEKVRLIPVVEFETPGGRMVKFRVYHRLLAAFQRPTVGAEVGVIYQRKQPDVGLINSFLTIWAVPVACTIIGGALLYGGIELLPGKPNNRQQESSQNGSQSLHGRFELPRAKA